MNRTPGERGAVSFLYTLLLERVNTNTEFAKQAWEKDLEIELTDESWENCLRNIHDCSINARQTP